MAVEEREEEVEDLCGEGAGWFDGGEKEADWGGYYEEEQDDEGVECCDEREQGREEG